MITNKQLKKLIIRISELEPNVGDYMPKENLSYLSYDAGYVAGFLAAQEKIIKLIPVK